MRICDLKKPIIENDEVLLNFDTTVLKKNTLVILNALPKANWKIDKPRADLIQEYLDFVNDAIDAEFSSNGLEDLLLYRLYENYPIWKDSPEYIKVMSDEAVAVATLFAVSGYQVMHVKEIDDVFIYKLRMMPTSNIYSLPQFNHILNQWDIGAIEIKFVGEPAEEVSSTTVSNQFLIDENLIDLPQSLREHLKECQSIDAIVLEVCKIMMWGPKYKRADDALSALISAWNTATK